MNLNQMFPVLKDENNETIRCGGKGCKRAARHIHHIVPRCEGGTDESSNLIHLCQKCHTAHHSSQGDFSKWGKMGGEITAATLKSIPNLKQFQGEAGKVRWAAYCERRASAQIGVQS